MTNKKYYIIANLNDGKPISEVTSNIYVKAGDAKTYCRLENLDNAGRYSVYQLVDDLDSHTDIPYYAIARISKYSRYLESRVYMSYESARKRCELNNKYEKEDQQFAIYKLKTIPL